MGIAFISNSIVGKAKQAKEDYGSKGNMIDCLDAQIRNARKTKLKADVVVLSGAAATGAATVAVKNSKTLQNAIVNGFQALKNSNIGKQVGAIALEALPYAKKGLAMVKALPGPAKAVLAVGTAITALTLRYISDKSVMKQGEINQQYKDKAKLQKQLS